MSPFIFGIFSHRFHHDSLRQAYEYLLERRRVAAPNLAFLLQLIRYEKELRATKDIDPSRNVPDISNPIQPLNVNNAGTDEPSSHDEYL